MKDTKEQRGWKSALSKVFTLVMIVGIFYWLINTNKPVETVAQAAAGVPSAVSPPSQTPQSIAGTIRTKSVRAKKNPSLEIAIDQPAFVAPYYRVSLFPQAAGIVTFIEKSIGDKVTAGERLVEIQVTGDGRWRCCRARRRRWNFCPERSCRTRCRIADDNRTQ
ncbi:MAG: hypothetical protein NTY97_05880 [Planctomycetota bacterium]|nr:hypothetical protein [Planctomycetota bacterium]